MAKTDKTPKTKEAKAKETTPFYSGSIKIKTLDEKTPRGKEAVTGTGFRAMDGIGRGKYETFKDFKKRENDAIFNAAKNGKNEDKYRAQGIIDERKRAAREWNRVNNPVKYHSDLLKDQRKYEEHLEKTSASATQKEKAAAWTKRLEKNLANAQEEIG
ncbi:MAG: hypothetical protein FWD49_01885 [Firmicutes bacterium]|nr:hypothetical protein [Bacillota bacterium]